MEAQNSQQVHQSKRINASCFSNDMQNFCLTDSFGSPVASFRFDHHNGQLAESWNPANLEIVNMKGGNRGSIRITTAVTGFDRDIYIPSWPPIEINPPPVNGNGNGNDWGGIGAVIGIGAYTDTRVTDTEKDCGEDPCENEDLLNFGMRFNRQRFYEFYPLITLYLYSICPDDGIQFHGIFHLFFVHTITEEAQDDFRNKGFSDEHISKISEKMGDCFRREGPTAHCFPILCPDGSCGIKCECLGETFDSCV